MVLRVYARMFTNDTDRSLALLRPLLGKEPDYRFTMGEWEITGIGDICLVAGTDHALAPIRGSVGPIVVDDLDATKQILIGNGAVITRDTTEAQTGKVFYAKHPDGTDVEYAQWNPDVVARLIGKQ